jgi:hypothetical protein
MEDVKRAIDAYGNNMVARKEYSMSLVIESLLHNEEQYLGKGFPHITSHKQHAYLPYSICGLLFSIPIQISLMAFYQTRQNDLCPMRWIRVQRECGCHLSELV